MIRTLVLALALVFTTVVAMAQPAYPSAAVTIYFDPSGSDVTGTGTSGNPFATPQHAMNYVCQSVNASQLPAASPGITVKSLTANTSYTAQITECEVDGVVWSVLEQTGFLTLDFNGSTLNCGSGTCMSGVHNTHAAWYWQNTVTAGTGWSAVMDSRSLLYLGPNMTLGTTTGDVSAAYGAQIEFEATWVSTGSKQYMMVAGGAGSQVIMRSGFQIVCSSASYAQVPMQAYNDGVISINGIGWGGSCTFPVIGGVNQVGYVATAGGIDGSASILGGIGTIQNDPIYPGWEN